MLIRKQKIRLEYPQKDKKVTSTPIYFLKLDPKSRAGPGVASELAAGSISGRTPTSGGLRPIVAHAHGWMQTLKGCIVTQEYAETIADYV